MLIVIRSYSYIFFILISFIVIVIAIVTGHATFFLLGRAADDLCKVAPSDIQKVAGDARFSEEQALIILLLMILIVVIVIIIM